MKPKPVFSRRQMGTAGCLLRETRFSVSERQPRASPGHIWVQEGYALGQAWAARGSCPRSKTQPQVSHLLGHSAKARPIGSRSAGGGDLTSASPAVTTRSSPPNTSFRLPPRLPSETTFQKNDQHPSLFSGPTVGGPVSPAGCPGLPALPWVQAPWEPPAPPPRRAQLGPLPPGKFWASVS